RRRGRAGAAVAEGHRPPRDAEGRAERSLSLRQRQEVQELPRGLTANLYAPPPPPLWEKFPRAVPAAAVGVLTALMTVAMFPPFHAPEFAYAFAVPAIFWAYRRPSLKL